MLITLQFPAGNYVATRMTARMGIDRTLLWGGIVGIASAIALLLLSPILSLWAILLPMIVYAFANGILFPNAMAGAASVDRRIAGTAASFAGFAQLGAGAVVAFTISALPTDSVMPYGYALVILAIATLVGVGLVYSSRRKT
jgi:DHA1 family bicyclomycin/chloramphenicol resistance-like MFS transporter